MDTDMKVRKTQIEVGESQCIYEDLGDDKVLLGPYGLNAFAEIFPRLEKAVNPQGEDTGIIFRKGIVEELRKAGIMMMDYSKYRFELAMQAGALTRYDIVYDPNS